MTIPAENPLQREPYPHPRRLVQLLEMTLLALAILLVQDLLDHQVVFGLLLVGAALPSGWAIWLARRGKTGLATGLTLGTLTVLASAFLWTGQGLRDPAVLVFPGVLLLAAIRGNRRGLLLLLGVMIVVMGVVTLANTHGWHVNHVRPVSKGTWISLTVILTVFSYMVWVLASDLRRALRELKAENLRSLQSQSQIEFLAQHDALTGLPNRLLARDRLEQDRAHACKNHHCVALMHLDLDDFKAINDSLGHLGGDDLLRQVGQRLQEELRTADTVCRQGGDEFLLVLPALKDSDDAAALASKVVSGMEVPFRVHGLDVGVTVSLGIALYPSDGDDFDILLQKADMAMYSAKESGRNTFRFFMEGMNKVAQEYLYLVSGLRSALEQGALVLHYQPQFDLASGKIAGAEALLRWQHPERGLVLPGEFIPIAERSGLISEIGAWALEEACRQSMVWRKQGLDLVVAVNISPVQFQRDDLEACLVQALQKAGLPAEAIELELTESMIIDDDARISQKLRGLRELGVRFSIDDFGTGYSNLGYLQRFDVERLKIDKSFILRLIENPQDEAIVRAMIQMAHGLNLSIVAEGIENQATLDRLVELNCDLGQGFHWAPALDAESFAAFVKEGNKRL